VGISEQTFYHWKKQYVGLESDQVREIKQLVADLSLDKEALLSVIQNNGSNS